MTKHLISPTIGGVLLSSVSAFAAPIPTSTIGMSAGQSSDVVQVMSKKKKMMMKKKKMMMKKDSM